MIPEDADPREADSAVSADGSLLGLQDDVAQACRIFTGTWPLEDFISANPLDGLIDKPFIEASRIAGEVLGARVTPPEAWMRGQYASGRITDTDLHLALETIVPQALRQPEITIGGSPFTPRGILMADLLHGRPSPDPVRTYLTAAQKLDQDVSTRIETQVITYLAGFFGEGQASWPMPGREAGLYEAWRRLAAYTPHVPRRARAYLRGLPGRADHALVQALGALGVPEQDRIPYLQAHLASLPGWASRVRGRESDPAREIENLLQYLAIRVSIEAAYLVPLHPDAAAYAAAPPNSRPASAAVPTPGERAAHVLSLLVTDATIEEREAAADILALLPVERREVVWLEAYEGHYRDSLLAAIDGPQSRVGAPTPPAAQVACCIDNRAEGLRRHLEQAGPYQTMGFAGFFSVAMRFANLSSSTFRHQHPGPGTAVFDLTEVPADGHGRATARHMAGRQSAAAARDAWHHGKDFPAAPFVLAEATGWAAGPFAAARTIAPRASDGLFHAIADRLAPEAVTYITIDALSRQTRTDTAQMILTLLGLTEGFARLVVFVGHSAATSNNPYQAVLDCGACGGHPGAPNARAAAELLNLPHVRADLAERGIHIPETTHFLPAEHNTTTDEVTVLDTHLIPDDHRDDVARLDADLRTAGERLALERVATLPGAPRRSSAARAIRHVHARSVDWAQSFPEWGLAGNTATIIAPRVLTRGVDLECRVFLHDYDHTSDPDGATLQTLLMGPTIVAQWISCQYYFSTVDPRVLGAGSKTLHNVIGGGQGVMAGATTDLQIGLPWQSLSDGRQLRHEPMRMLTLVQAPTARLDDIIVKNPMLADLVTNEWITLCARVRDDEPWQRHTATGWHPLAPAGADHDGR